MKFSWLAVSMALAAAPAAAMDVNVIGLFPGKAVIVVNRGAPRTLSVGSRTPEGVLLVSVDSDSAVIEVEGKREKIEMGRHFESAEQSASRSIATFAADENGQFVVNGAVNGGHMRFIVDTGATLVSFAASDARRLGIDYRQGTRHIAVMADGRRVAAYSVKLDSVTAGELTLFNVEASVHEGAGMGVGLLGMSFLNRTEMRREGANLTLTKRY